MAVAMQMAQAGKLYRQQVADEDTGRCISMKESFFSVYIVGELFTTVDTPSPRHTFVKRQLPLNKKTLKGIKEVPKWSWWDSSQAADRQQVRRAQQHRRKQKGALRDITP